MIFPGGDRDVVIGARGERALPPVIHAPCLDLPVVLQRHRPLVPHLDDLKSVLRVWRGHGLDAEVTRSPMAECAIGQKADAEVRPDTDLGKRNACRRRGLVVAIAPPATDDRGLGRYNAALAGKDSSRQQSLRRREATSAPSAIIGSPPGDGTTASPWNKPASIAEYEPEGVFNWP